MPIETEIESSLSVWESLFGRNDFMINVDISSLCSIFYSDKQQVH